MKKALGLFLLLSASASTTLAQTYPPVEVFKSPTCRCCSKWVEHLKSNGFRVNAHDISDVNVERKRLAGW